ncbi:MAG: hypothetical protein F4X97_05510 [Boseongicola sp. SB0662_bin_57]|nr:hypothetical protein [Boseongicola sp. SB0662_bin_57]
MLAPTADVLATGRGKKDKRLHWKLPVTETGLDTSRAVLRWDELRWRIGRFSQALKVGTPLRARVRRLGVLDGQVAQFALVAVSCRPPRPPVLRLGAPGRQE